MANAKSIQRAGPEGERGQGRSGQYYPGGLDLAGGYHSGSDTWTTYLFEPGVYYIGGGGGFRVANAGIVVDPGGSTLGGDVLIFPELEVTGLVE